jgi:hypothetical protein
VLYTYALTVPAGTLEKAPVEADLQLTSGVITHIEVLFAPGAAWVVNAYVRQGLHQIWPTNPDGKARGDDSVVASDEYCEISAADNVVTLGAYSPAASYIHEIIFRLEVTPYDIAERGAQLDTWIDKIGRLLGVK